MIILTGDGMWIGGQQSVGPYGYLCLGLVYHWDDEREILVLKNMVLVKVDIALRQCTEIGLYFDMFERPVDKITEKDGIHYYEDLPILNYDMLDMPEQLDVVITEEVKEFSFEEMKMVPSPRRKTEHSVNRVCTPPNNSFIREYTELYACLLNFNRRTRTGYLVGFDCLGKILRRPFCLNELTDDNDIRRELLKDMAWSEWKYSPEYEERQKECGFLNFDCRLNKDGKLICKYDSIWSGLTI